MTAEIILISAAGVLFAYPALQAFILRSTEGTRLALAEQGRLLLTDPKISEEHKVFISSMLDDVFSWQFAAKAAIVFPRVVFTSRRESHLSAEDRAFLTRDDVREFMNLHFRSAMAASPFWTFIFFISAILTLVFVLATIGMSAISLLWGDTVKHVSPTVGGRDDHHTSAPA